MYYTMNVSLNYFRKHVSQNIFSENIIKFYGGTNEMAISKDMIIADLIALDPNYAAILMASGMDALDAHHLREKALNRQLMFMEWT